MSIIRTNVIGTTLDLAYTGETTSIDTNRGKLRRINVNVIGANFRVVPRRIGTSIAHARL